MAQLIGMEPFPNNTVQIISYIIRDDQDVIHQPTIQTGGQQSEFRSRNPSSVVNPLSNFFFLAIGTDLFEWGLPSETL